MEPRQPAAAAYLITFHTYGTWLPGDPRGTVPRHQNRYGEPKRGRCDALMERARGLLQSPPVVLEPEERVVVLNAFQEVCRHRSWALLAAHVRTNHVHIVVSAGALPGRMMGDDGGPEGMGHAASGGGGTEATRSARLGAPRKHTLPVASSGRRGRVLLRSA
jgi:hypothetical protein